MKISIKILISTPEVEILQGKDSMCVSNLFGVLNQQNKMVSSLFST